MNLRDNIGTMWPLASQFRITRLAVRGLIVFCCVVGLLKAQNGANLSEFFEGKQVTVKMDMPGTQQGVDVYPQRSQPLDLKSYSSRLKKFGIALRNGDTVLITKVKVKDSSVEFQLAGGGYGTAFDDTDSSVHYTPSDKSGREKDLEDQIRNETDPARRRSLQRELDDVRSARERRDNRNLAIAQSAADSKRQQIDTRRQSGGSRFNVRFDKRDGNAALTPQLLIEALQAYVTFSAATFGGEERGTRSEVPGNVNGGPPLPPDNSAGVPAADSLKKGLSREQVEAMYGQPTATHDRMQDGLKITSCTYQSKDSNLQADFVNGILVQYTVSSR